MIDGRGRVRITDFGLAALGETPTGAAARAGTPAYMSPEQFTEEPCTVASDLYAVGLVLYEVISGRRVFDANRIEEYRRLHTERKPTSLSHRVPEVEPEIEQLISQCLEKDPAKRPASAHEILAALPGGDPLSVALAAGETPSPELVAAAAPSEGMPQSVSLACLIAILLGMIALPFVNDRVNLYAFAPLAKPPIVLVDRARQVIEGLGYTQPAVDSSCGFEGERRLPVRDRDAGRIRGTLERVGPRPAGGGALLVSREPTIVDPERHGRHRNARASAADTGGHDAVTARFERTVAVVSRRTTRA